MRFLLLDSLGGSGCKHGHCDQSKNRRHGPLSCSIAGILIADAFTHLHTTTLLECFASAAAVPCNATTATDVGLLAISIDCKRKVITISTYVVSKQLITFTYICISRCIRWGRVGTPSTGHRWGNRFHSCTSHRCLSCWSPYICRSSSPKIGTLKIKTT